MAQALDLDKPALTGDVIRVAENVDTNAPSSSFSVSRSGVLVYWAAARTFTELKWFGQDGTPVGPAVARGAISNFSISRDGTTLVADRNDTSPSSIWLYDLRRGGSTRLTFDFYANNPVASADGSRIIFGSARDSPPNIYLKNIGSTQPDERLLRSTFVDFPLDWSAEAAVSPDSKWMAYSSTESGRSEVYVMRFPEGGERRPISTAGGYLPRWRADGKELYYRDKQRIMAVAVTAGATFAVSTPRVLFEASAMPAETDGPQSYTVAPDGRFLLNTVVERTSPPLTVVSDWRVGLVR
jgi:hypothetical protein